MSKRDSARWTMSDADVDALRVGDVLLYGRLSKPRVVRAIKWHANTPQRGRSKGDPQGVSVSFAIRRCSWTGRAWTTLSRTDLRLNCRPAGRRAKVANSKLAVRLLREIHDPPPTYFSLRCCDVIGVVD
jgi:hypothetical protein